MISALLALALTSTPPTFDRTFAWTLRGERVGSLHVSFDGKQFRYESVTVVRRGNALSTQKFGATTDASGHGRTDDGRALEGPLPSTLALWMFGDREARRCIDVEDERDGKRGQVCGERRGDALSGTLLGESFTADLADGGPIVVELPSQQARFQESGALPLPVPRDLFVGTRRADALSNLIGVEHARVRAEATNCSLDLQLKKPQPPRDEPLEHHGDSRWSRNASSLSLKTTTRWATAAALANFVDQAIVPVATSPTGETAESVWQARRGSCVGQAELFDALATGSGLPSRVVYGVLVEDGELAPHAWNEVQVSGNWIGVDPSRGVAPVGPEHIPFGRDGDSDPLRAGRCLLALPTMKWSVDAR
ncbi:MAG: transglutaminase domain-containing protein [Deltaproteobacteria bacterium]|nr:transglutaminase domain-containing protein [Deltaproteobacteria bacterium]